jgi:hypothetical protein
VRFLPFSSFLPSQSRPSFVLTPLPTPPALRDEGKTVAIGKVMKLVERDAEGAVVELDVEGLKIAA